MRTTIWMAALATLALATGTRAADEKPAKPAPDHDHGLSPAVMKCIEECAKCAKECETCSAHCTAMLAAGKKDHERSLRLTRDCADLCAVSAQIMARNGPLMHTSCMACGKACEVCAADCEKFKDSEQMQKCAKACRDCAKACQDMVKEMAEK